MLIFLAQVALFISFSAELRWRERNKVMQPKHSFLPIEMKWFLPFVVDAEAGQASDGVSLNQLLQADCTFPCILGQDVLCETADTSHHWHQ